MTNTEISPARWVTSSRTAKSGYDTLFELFRKEAPADEVAELFTALTGLRGVHRVEIKRNHADYVGGVRVESPWFSLLVKGTDRGCAGAKNLLMMSGLQELDKNADHDHAACIASAAKMGVPAAYAHTPETYLSS